MQKLSGLYAITPANGVDLESLLLMVRQALHGGARLIQYRDKGTDQGRRQTEAIELLSLCRQYDVPLIINDDLKLAEKIGADGVHLGQYDETIGQARRTLGSSSIIGASCYNDFSLAEKATEEGADYVAFGSFFCSGTKPNAVPANLQLLQRAKEQLGLPVVAIGGITLQNAPPLIEAGADMLAVIQGVFAQNDIRHTAKTFAALFES